MCLQCSHWFWLSLVQATTPCSFRVLRRTQRAGTLCVGVAPSARLPRRPWMDPCWVQRQVGPPLRLTTAALQVETCRFLDEIPPRTLNPKPLTLNPKFQGSILSGSYPNLKICTPAGGRGLQHHSPCSAATPAASQGSSRHVWRLLQPILCLRS